MPLTKVNRTIPIFSVFLIASLLLPTMACMFPGAQLSLEEAECCKNMASNCGDMVMPDHACCQTTASKAIVNQIGPEIGKRVSLVISSAIYSFDEALPTIRSNSNPFPIDRGAHPPLIPLRTIDILRI